VSDGALAVVGLGSIGSMALWQASQADGSVVGFEASTPAHPRSAVGGDTRLFRMTFRGDANYYPVLQHAQRRWRELEEQSGQSVLIRCGGLSIGEVDGRYIPALLESIKRTGAPHEILDHDEMGRRYPQHRLGASEVGIFDAEAGALRTDRAVLAAVQAARNNGARVLTGTPVREIREVPNGVRVSTDADTWVFDRVIVASGAWSRSLLPAPLQDRVHPRRNYLTWFPARDPAEFSPEKFPIFIHITARQSLYGTPTIDGATVKATLDGRSRPTEEADTVDRALSPAEIAESEETVAAFLPGLIPSIVRSDAYPDLFTSDEVPIVGFVPGSERTYVATGFSGQGFKMASAFGAIAAAETLGRHHGVEGLDFVRPGRFL
jgi:sarcosine oxidase